MEWVINMEIKTKMTITAKNHILRQNAAADKNTHPFKYVVIGTGGVSTAGLAREATGLENKLYNMVKRFDLKKILMAMDIEAPDRYRYKLRIPSSDLVDIAAFSEIGIEDENHNLLFIGCFESIKIIPQRHLILDMENSFAEG